MLARTASWAIEGRAERKQRPARKAAETSGPVANRRAIPGNGPLIEFMAKEYKRPNARRLGILEARVNRDYCPAVMVIFVCGLISSHCCSQQTPSLMTQTTASIDRHDRPDRNRQLEQFARGTRTVVAHAGLAVRRGTMRAPVVRKERRDLRVGLRRPRRRARSGS